MSSAPPPSAATLPAGWNPQQSRRRIWFELGLVLAVSLGQAAIYSIVALLRALTRTEALADQSTTINQAIVPEPWWDLVYQLLGSFFSLVPVALALYFLWQPGVNAFRRIGLDVTRFGRNLGGGVILTLVIGVPGLALYFAGRALGITVNVVPTALDTYWWTVPVLLLAALRAALEEEVIVVGFLFAKLRDLGWKPWLIIGVSAMLRGSYHLYQGFGPFIGNVAMGIIFGWAYQRWGRVMPLVIAHFLLDALTFIGYPLVAAAWPTLFR